MLVAAHDRFDAVLGVRRGGDGSGRHQDPPAPELLELRGESMNFLVRVVCRGDIRYTPKPAVHDADIPLVEFFTPADAGRDTPHGALVRVFNAATLENWREVCDDGQPLAVGRENMLPNTEAVRLYQWLHGQYRTRGVTL